MFPITVPPLRERPEDIPELVRHFLVRFAAEEGKRIRAVTADALALLNAHPWPGNVRQLENAVFRAVVLADGDEIGASEFPQLRSTQEYRRRPFRRPRIVPHERTAAPLILEEAPTTSPYVSRCPGGRRAAARLMRQARSVRSRRLEAEVIRFAIAHYRGQMSEVARRLRIGRSTLYRKLDELGLGAGEIRRHRTQNVASG